MFHFAHGTELGRLVTPFYMSSDFVKPSARDETNGAPEKFTNLGLKKLTCQEKNRTIIEILHYGKARVRVSSRKNRTDKTKACVHKAGQNCLRDLKVKPGGRSLRLRRIL